MTDRDRPILVVGAGPTGLTLALALARFGVRARLVERALAPAGVSKALAVWSGSLEAFAALGVVEPFLAAGRRMETLRVGDGPHELAAMPLGEGVDSVYPFTLVLPQSETEAILARRLDELGGRVERGVELVGLADEADGIRATLAHAEGTTEILHAACVVGCDGARSTVRNSLGIAFEGYTEPQTFILCDAVIEGGLDPSSAYIWWSGAGSVALLPIADGVWRTFAMRAEPAGDEPPTLKEMQAHLAASGPPGLVARDPRWLSAFRVSERLAERYRVGRILIAGDAAHVHSPAGGQGMNTGIQDAVNLAWKLAAISSGRGEADALLDSYEAERRPVARAVVAAAAQKLHLGMTAKGAGQRILRDALVSVASRLPPLRRRLQVELSETDFVYRAGPLVEIARRANGHGSPAVGERARDAPLRNPESGDALPLWPFLAGPHHTLLVFGDPSEHADLLARASRLGDSVEVVKVEPARDPAGTAAARYGVLNGGWVLVRPDQVVAARGGVGEVRGFVAYAGRALEAH
jgi:2-polyprenyl-6-methoxyphenol hydroxylase-like FAD-dependent oxidoreductase